MFDLPECTNPAAAGFVDEDDFCCEGFIFLMA
jgi:hypothetical protein